MYKISYNYDEEGNRGDYSSFGFNGKTWENYSKEEIIANCNPENMELDENAGCGARIVIEGYKMNY